MTRPPPVSVVVAAREEAEDLPAALASVLAQDYEGTIEIVVADGSEGPETAGAVRARFPQVRIVANPAGSTPAGLNRAVAAAAHDIVLRCDARSRLPPGYVREALATLARTGAAVVGGMQRPVGTTAFTRAVAMAMTMPLGAGDARYRIGGPEGPVDTVWLGVFRRAALEAAGGFDETLLRNQDYELNWRIRAGGGTVWFTPALVADYRPRGSFRALARQYFDWGRWKRVVLRRHPASLRWRHLAAPALSAVLALSAAAGAATWSPFAAALPLAYLLALAAGAAERAVRCRDAAAALLLAPVLATMHLAWGAGFWRACFPTRRGPARDSRHDHAGHDCRLPSMGGPRDRERMTKEPAPHGQDTGERDMRAAGATVAGLEGSGRAGGARSHRAPP